MRAKPSPFRRIYIGASFFIATLLIAVLGYTLSDCPVFTSLYMTIITVFGVGFGEACPVQTIEERLFTIFVIFAGYGSAAYAVGGFIQMVAEGEIHEALAHRRKTKNLAKLNGHTLICGFGRIGQVMARKLAESKEPFVIIDASDARIQAADDLGYHVCQGNATTEATLLAAGIDRAKVLATALPDDAMNVFITLTARGLNADLTIVARGELPSTEKKLRLAGANHVISPASISGVRMATLITHPNSIEFLDQGEERDRLNQLLGQIDVQVDELTISAQSALVGRPLGDLEVRGNGTFIVVGVKRTSGEMMMHPPHEMLLEAEDVVIVLGHRGDIPQISNLYELKPQLSYRGGRSWLQ